MSNWSSRDVRIAEFASLSDALSNASSQVVQPSARQSAALSASLSDALSHALSLVVLPSFRQPVDPSVCNQFGDQLVFLQNFLFTEIICY